jgi:hypothetical protein
MRTSIVRLIFFLLVGCATGSRYDNAQTQDAAMLVANSASWGSFQFKGGMLIKIEKIDRATAPEAPLYLAPGAHRLIIWLGDRWNNQALVEANIVVGANKSYRVDASKNDRLFTLQIIDVASGTTVCTEKAMGYYAP